MDTTGLGTNLDSLPSSINPDDPTFYDYDGVTLDYVYAYMSWGLSLSDLK